MGLLVNKIFDVYVCAFGFRKEIDQLAHRGLRQRDTLSPFLFLIVVEWATQIGSFQGFEVSSNIHHSILQFVDDTILWG